MLADVSATSPLESAPDGILRKMGLIEAPDNCPPAKFIGVRASGEREEDYWSPAYGTVLAHEGFGYTVRTAANLFAEQIPLAEIDHVDYPAVSLSGFVLDWTKFDVEFAASTSEGLAKTMGKVNEFVSRCPDKPIVIAGFSQGATVVGDAYQRMLETPLKKHIAAVVMFGDPRFNAKQKSGINQGQANFDPKLDGILTSLAAGTLKEFGLQYDTTKRTFFDKSFPNKKPGDYVQSYCSYGDIVCNAPDTLFTQLCMPHDEFIPQVTQCPHGRYVELGLVQQGADFMADRAKAWIAAHP
jgi:hypothetical protein